MEWLDPEKWRSLAAIVSSWKEIAGAVGVLAGAVIAIAKWGWTPLRWLAQRIGETHRKPATALSFVLNDQKSGWSGILDKRGITGTRVHAMWRVTNTSDRSVLLRRARLRNHNADTANVCTLDPSGQVFGHIAIGACSMSEVVADLTFFPPICSGTGTNPLIADVIFTDNYGDEHKLRRVRFRYAGPSSA